jgi:hypothetical protein
MSLKLTYYGQNDSVNCTPAVVLTGDPGTDQQTLTAAGYLGGVIVALTALSTNASYPIQPTYEPAMGSIGNIVPADNSSATTYGTTNGNTPFAVLLNGPGEFAGAIGPSGSRKAPVVRALWQGNVDFQGYDSNVAVAFVVGHFVYCGGTGNTNIGKYTDLAHIGTGGVATPIGICTHIPTASEPWLGVASLL